MALAQLASSSHMLSWPATPPPVPTPQPLPFLPPFPVTPGNGSPAYGLTKYGTCVKCNTVNDPNNWCSRCNGDKPSMCLEVSVHSGCTSGLPPRTPHVTHNHKSAAAGACTGQSSLALPPLTLVDWLLPRLPAVQRLRVL